MIRPDVADTLARIRIAHVLQVEKIMRKIARLALLAIAAGVSAPALAIEICDSPVFFCKIENTHKAVSLCEYGNKLTYSFGPVSGDPELELTVPRKKATVTPWNGMGYIYWSTIQIPSGQWTYMLHNSFERGDPDAKDRGSLTVLRNGQEVREFVCDPDTVDERIETLAN